jgi:hypothetical protein
MKPFYHHYRPLLPVTLAMLGFSALITEAQQPSAPNAAPAQTAPSGGAATAANLLERLRSVREKNAATLEAQKKTLQQLETLQEQAQSIRILAKRT